MGAHHWHEPAGRPLRYRRDVPADDPDTITTETEHVRVHLAAIADTDDDPTTHADDVTVRVVDHIDGDPALVSIIGELDATPDAPYLRDDYDPDTEPPFHPPGDTPVEAWEAGP